MHTKNKYRQLSKENRSTEQKHLLIYHPKLTFTSDTVRMLAAINEKIIAKVIIVKNKSGNFLPQCTVKPIILLPLILAVWSIELIWRP